MREVILQPVLMDAGGGAVVVVEKVVLSASQLDLYLTYRSSDEFGAQIEFIPAWLKAHVGAYRWDFDGSVPEVDKGYVLSAGEQRSFLLRYTGYPSSVDPWSVSQLRVWLPGVRGMASFREALQPGPVAPVEVDIPLGTE